MTRHALLMQLKPGCVAEYQRRHDALWPELAEALQAAGVSDYSIFLDESTLTLFAVQKRRADHTVDQLPANPVVQRWWAMMSDLLETQPNHAPVTRDLREVFHLE